MMPLGADKAHAYVPAKSERLDAKRFARDWWAQRGHKPRCYNIGFRWRALPRNELAFVASDRDGSSKCVVVFNSRVDWEYNQARDSEYEWWRLCRVAIHEYGHLYGMPYEWAPWHSRNPNSVMNASEDGNLDAWWWPYFPGCRFDGDGVG
jgi:hypothetical protein